MQDTTIDIGIDLGTTNSAVAIMNGGNVEIVKNGLSEITPSCVYLDRSGNVKIGDAAKQRLINAKSTNDVRQEFKRLMGQRESLRFKSAQREMSPEELSAEVLKELRRACESRFGTPPRAAVVTIPAMFEEPQREATARAAKLAGFDHCQLLQEPVAAAVAHGFRAETEKAFWLVYDFGGGTFDASIVTVRDGQLSVVNHAGDNYLGGSDFDWKIVEHILLPRLNEQYDLKNHSRSNMERNEQVCANLFRLKQIAEAHIKIPLSRSEVESFNEPDVFDDESGESVEIDLQVTRGEFDALIGGMVNQSIRTVQQLLKDSNLTAGDIEKVILVGGTTFTPLVRERIAELGMSLDLGHDPMTVVAQGAAIFAASQRMPEQSGTSQPVSKGTARLQLEFQPVTKESTPLVGGKVILDGGAPKPGTVIEVRREDDGWSSGPLTLESGGMFFCNVTLAPNSANTFSITVRDKNGVAIPVSPDSLTITHGLSVGKASLPQSIRLALHDGKTDVLLAKGVSMPSHIEGHRVRTTKALRAGDPSDELHVPFCEGEEEVADRNRIGGTIIIRGDKISRPLPEDTELEVSAEVDSSGIAHFRIYVPILDEEFEIDVASRSGSEIVHEEPGVMRKRLELASERANELRQKADELDESTAKSRLQQINADACVADIRGNIDAWEGGDHSAAGRARNQQVELDKQLDEVATIVEWPTLLSTFDDETDRTRQIVHEVGDDADEQSLNQLEQEGKQAIAAKDAKMLNAVVKNLGGLAARLVMQDPAAWAAMLQQIARDIHMIPERARAESLVKEGSQAMQRGDVSTLQSVVRQLLTMLPREAAERAQLVRSDVRQ